MPENQPTSAEKDARLADAWDEGWAAGMADAAYLGRGEDVPLTRNPHRSRVDLDPASDHDPEAFIDAEHAAGRVLPPAVTDGGAA